MGLAELVKCYVLLRLLKLIILLLSHLPIPKDQRPQPLDGILINIGLKGILILIHHRLLKHSRIRPLNKDQNLILISTYRSHNNRHSSSTRKWNHV